jgi:hypothetical protein
LRAFVKNLTWHARVIDFDRDLLVPGFARVLIDFVFDRELGPTQALKRKLNSTSMRTQKRTRSSLAEEVDPAAFNLFDLLETASTPSGRCTTAIVHILEGGVISKIGSRHLQPYPFPLHITAPITVVGGLETCSRFLGVAAAEQEDLGAAIRAAIKNRVELLPRGGQQDDVWTPDESFSWLRFLTPDEYAAEVGALQVALETRRDPYKDAPAVYLP